MAIRHRTFKKKRRTTVRNRKLPRRFLPLSTYRLALLHPKKKINIFSQPRLIEIKKKRFKKRSRATPASSRGRRSLNAFLPTTNFKKFCFQILLRKRLKLLRAGQASNFKRLLKNASVKWKKALFFKNYFFRTKLFVKIAKQPAITDWLVRYKRRRYLMCVSRLSENYRIIKNFRNNYKRNKAEIISQLRLLHNTIKIKKHWNKGNNTVLKYFYIKKNKLQRRLARNKAPQLVKYLKKCSLKVSRMRSLRRKSKLRSKKWCQRLVQSTDRHKLALKRFQDTVNMQQIKLARKHNLSGFRSRRLYLYRLDLLRKFQKYRLSKFLYGLESNYKQIWSAAVECLKLHFKFKKKVKRIRRTASVKLLRFFLSNPKKLRIKKGRVIFVRARSRVKSLKNKIFLSKTTVIRCKKIEPRYLNPANIRKFLTKKPNFHNNDVVPVAAIRQKNYKYEKQSTNPYNLKLPLSKHLRPRQALTKFQDFTAEYDPWTSYWSRGDEERKKKWKNIVYQNYLRYPHLKNYVAQGPSLAVKKNIAKAFVLPNPQVLPRLVALPNLKIVTPKLVISSNPPTSSNLVTVDRSPATPNFRAEIINEARTYKFHFPDDVWAKMPRSEKSKHLNKKREIKAYLAYVRASENKSYKQQLEQSRNFYNNNLFNNEKQ